ncbi:MATE family efflux transporter [Chitinophaga arvensicola]|uniref:Membrane protein involved in the export of O-antigen and teichoic acid n=1 Tax=Chitinophaga arvensicola TaxID=29529 RepID=A0A1I0S8M9_9BACT|nr:polysaccharide biosynthesis C-terminal domain-containing protein [Chitinophaga arvensicola]SEW52478.1 Membrane protein involved in the export of O-antigen and teichoic acid [Chitinophaga arvensicola]
MSFLRKSIFVTGGQMAGIMLNMLAGVIYSRSLGPGGMGQYELFRSSQMVVVTFLSLGMGTASIYFLNNLKYEPREIISNTAKVSLLFGGLLIIGFTAAIVFNPGYFGTISFMIALLFSFGSAALVNISTLRPVLVAQLASKRMVVIDMLPRIIILLSGLLMLLISKRSPAFAITALGVGNTVACCTLFYFLREHLHLRTPFNWKLLGSLLKYSIKLSASNFLYVLTSNVTVMLLRYTQQQNFNQVGLYTRAVAISGMITLIPSTVGPLLYAKWAGLKGDLLTKQAEFAMRVSSSVSFVISAGVYIFSRYIIHLLYGPSFYGANVALRILAPSLVFITISSICNNLLAGDGKALITMYILMVTFSIVAGVTWFTVGRLGIEGAALAVLCGNIFSAVAGIVVCNRQYGLNIANCLVIRRPDIQTMLKSLKSKKQAAVIK